MSTNTPENTEQLGSINKKILAVGADLPAVELADGSKVQTGTVATMLHNVKLYNDGTRGEIERELELSVPTLVKVGLFELFSPAEWISGSNPGRRLVGEKAKSFLERDSSITPLNDQMSE
ncbi:MAG: hypothetical protein K0R08_1465 [Solimicrobium sp.]|jgi:hypothetical protein|nr:hypothetical protein [Solimicrobium sp.]